MTESPTVIRERHATRQKVLRRPARPHWTPVLPSATPGEFRITDLLTFAGVAPLE